MSGEFGFLLQQGVSAAMNSATRGNEYIQVQQPWTLAKSPESREKLERVLTCDPGIGVVRHADAGYEIARQTAAARGLRLFPTE